MGRVIKVIQTIFFLGLTVLILAGLQRLVMPKYTSDVVEGNFTAEYYEETMDHDVIFIGDCEVYENIDPIYLWTHFGITSYIRGNAQQLTWQSYYILEDTLQTEIPKVVIYNVQALTYAEPQREEYNRMTLDAMRWSSAKVKAVQASMCQGEQFLEYIFPLLRYHSRIMDLTRDDLSYFWHRPKVTHNGYYMRTDILPASQSDVADPSWLPWDTEDEGDEIKDPWADIGGAEEEGEESALILSDGGGEPFGSLPMKYLDKMRLLCEKKGIQLILMKAPSLAPRWYDSDNQQIVEYATKHHLDYINFYELLEETGIDYETDTYDGGLHMNLYGADKLSEYLGKILTESDQVKSHRGESAYEKVYEEKLRFYEEMKMNQSKNNENAAFSSIKTGEKETR